MDTGIFETLDTKHDWQGVLTTLVAAATAACLPNTGSAPAREAARQDLRAFRNFPCPFGDLQRTALEALNDLTLTDISVAMSALSTLKSQLEEDKAGFKAAGIAAASPRPQLRRAHAALADLSQTAHPELARQLAPVQEILSRLLASQPADPDLDEAGSATPS